MISYVLLCDKHPFFPFDGNFCFSHGWASYAKRSELASSAFILLFLPRFFCTGAASLGRGALVIEGEQTAQDFLTGRGANRVADTVVLGQGLNLVEVVAQVEVMPAVGVADGFIEYPVQAA